MNYLQLTTQWRIEERNGELFVYGGEDAIFTVEHEDASHSFFATLKHSQQFSERDIPKPDQLVLEQLLSAGVITPILIKKQHSKIRVKVIAKKPNFSLLFADKDLEISRPNSAHDLLILVRTNETLRDFLRINHYLEVTEPHLFIDLAFNHVISLGPLVFPGTTACVACLEGRLSTRWGDAKPPVQPKSSKELSGLATEWLSVELKKIFIDEDYSLTNKTIVFDVQNRTLLTNRLLIVPLCPYCKKGKLLSSGKLEYNFAKAYK